MQDTGILPMAESLAEAARDFIMHELVTKAGLSLSKTSGQA
jgi:hypothetical protein